MRFIGNKTRLISQIQDFISENIQGENLIFCDLFSGTGSVGNSLKDKFEIISNDYMYFSYILTSAYLENSQKPKFKKLGYDPISYFNNYRRTNIGGGFFYDNYSPGKSERMYFSSDNAAKIDFIRSKINKWKNENKITGREYRYLIAVLIESTTKVSNVAGVYGSYLKTWDPRAHKKLVLNDLDLIKSKSRNKSYNKNASELINKIEGDILYIDPPYTKNDYPTQYHILETLAKYDNPEIVGKTGTRTDKEKSAFADKYKVLVEFEKIIANAKFKYIVVSYSNKGLMDKSYIEKILKKYSKEGTYRFKSVDYRKFANNRTSEHNQPVEEYLFFVEKQNQLFVESPLNYMGSKFKMLDNIFEFMGNDHYAFVDVFGGGFNVGINSKAKKIIYNDTNHYLKNLIEMFKKADEGNLLSNIDRRIKKYGLRKKNKEAFVNLRTKYNKTKVKDWVDLYLLLMFGFQQQFRFNSKHEFNNTVGMSDYNENTVLKVIEFSRTLKEKNVILNNNDFENININEDSVVYYCDPPYYITLGSYNDGKRGFNGWGEKEERRLYAWLDKLHHKNKKFVLSNILVNKNKENSILAEWLKKSNYHFEEIVFRSRKEILVKNY